MRGMMRLAIMGVPGAQGAGAPATYDEAMQSYVTASQLPRWYRFNEPSGTTLVNHGSGGTALNGTVTSATIAQAGQLGAAEAYLFDGLNDYVSCAGGASNDLDTFTHMWLYKPLSLNQNGRVWGLGTSATRLFSSNAVNYRPGFQRDFATTNAFVVLDSGGFTLEQWVLLFVVHDMSGDRKARMYHATTSAGVALTATAGQASAGAITGVANGAYIIGARGVPDQFAHAEIDEHGLFSVALSTDQMNALAAFIFAA